MKKHAWVLWMVGAVILVPAFMAWGLDQSPGWANGLTASALMTTVVLGVVALHWRRWIAGTAAGILAGFFIQALVIGPSGWDATLAILSAIGFAAVCWWWWRN